MGGLWHLAKRFAGSLRPGPPAAADEAWAVRHLLAGEQAIWQRMSNPDRRHAVEVARAVVSTIDDGRLEAGGGRHDPVDREVVAAALLHDSGKVESGLRTPGRVLATVLWAVADDATAERWAAEPATTVRGRFGRYRRHPEIGSRLLREAGSASLTERWAAEHHLRESDWTVPPALGRILKDCDDD